MGYGTSLGTAHEDEISYVMEKGLTDKQLADQSEMNQNEKSGDFQSRFYATDQSTMPLEASGKLTDALKSYGSTQTPGKQYETKLSPEAEPKFQEWKAQNAPKDSGEDYDLRGAFAAGVGPDPATGHWPDTWKKPNHPTFSDQSMYAKDAPGLAGTWDGDTYVPPKRTALGQLTGSDGGERFQTWPERLARSAFTLPGDVLSGKVEPGSIQEIERASDLAGLMVMGPAPVAAKLADGSLGSFAGVKSRTLPKDKLYEAQNMELDAMHPNDIWDKTGFFRGADTRWRYEIADKDAKLKPEAFDTIIEQPTQAQLDGLTWTPQGDKIVPKSPIKHTDANFFDSWIAGKADKPLILREVLDHPELFKAYPELGTMKVEPLPKFLEDKGIKGQVSGDTIYLAPGHPEYVRSVILHEVQHGIQHHEGFAFGGMQEQFLPKELPQAEKEFLQVKQDAEKPLKDRRVDVEQTKAVLRDELRGVDMKRDIEFLKKTFKMDDKDIQRLRNIVKSENLLQQAKSEAFTKYKRLMGEVEARNVQARANLGVVGRNQSPISTEDTPRRFQINSSDKSATAMSADIPGGFTPYSRRWPNNDNVRLLNEHEEFLKRYDEWHAFGEKMNSKSELDTHKYNKLGKALADWQGVPYEPIQHDPLNIRGLRKE